MKCAPEIFQRTTYQMVEDFDGVVFMDDVIVAGDGTMHDKQRRCETPLPLLAASSTSTSMAEVLLQRQDHRYLQAISTKPLSQAPLRFDRMLLGLRGCDVEICYIPSYKQVFADTLNRAAAPTVDSEAYEEF